MSKLMLDVDQAGELKAAFRRGDWTNEEIKKLCEGDILVNVRKVLLGYAEFKILENIIDCDAAPFIPNGWMMEEHQKGGQFKWDKEAQKDNLYLDEEQQNGKFIEGNKLRKRLAGKPVLNANVLDYLLAHPHLIPEEWRFKVVFFWGTIYCTGGSLCVRSLGWHPNKWDGHGRWLDHVWDSIHPAVLRAS